MGSQGAALGWNLLTPSALFDEVSTGSDSDRVISGNYTSPDVDPVATAPGTDLIVLNPHHQPFSEREKRRKGQPN